MARHGPVDLVHWMAGLDLAGLGALVDVQQVRESQTVDVTPLGERGVVRHVTPLGTLEYTLSELGWLDTGQTSLRSLLAGADGRPAFPWQSILGHAGRDIGAGVTLATDMRLAKHDVVTSLDDLTKVSVEYFLSTGGEALDAELLAHGVQESVAAPGTPAAATRLDLGSAHTGGAEICLMADVGASRWRGYPALALSVWHSANGTSWNQLGSTLNLNRAAKGSAMLSIAAGTTINRYVAVRWTFSGTRDAFAKVGATRSRDNVLDGGTGTERLEPGDMVMMGNATYEVVTATERTATPGTWDVVFATRPTSANSRDNTVATLTGNNVQLRYAAAIHLR